MQVYSKSHKANQKGYSLLELSVALSIVAVIIVAGLMGARQVLQSNTTNNQIRESSQTISKLRKNLNRQNSTAELTGSTASQLGVWPNDRFTCTADTPPVCTNRAMFNGAFEHAFTNVAAHGTLAINTGVVYVLRNVPTQACTDLVNGLDSSALAIFAGPTTTAPTTGAIPAGFTTVKAADAANVSVANLATGCTSASGFSDVYAAIQVN